MPPDPVEVTIHSLSGQVVKVKVSSAVTTVFLNGVILKSFGVPAAFQRILLGTTVLSDTNLPLHSYDILPPKTTLSFISTPIKGIKISMRVDQWHTEAPITAWLRGRDNVNLEYIRNDTGFGIDLMDLRKQTAYMQWGLQQPMKL